MDQETKEYLERKLLGLVTKEDLEKWRQETKSNFRQIKEESKNHILEFKEEIKKEMGQLNEEGKVEIKGLLEEFKQDLGKSNLEIRSAMDQSKQTMVTAFQQVHQEVTSAIGQSREEVNFSLRSFREQEMADLTHLIKGNKLSLGQLREETDTLNQEIRQVVAEVTALNEKIKAGFEEVKEELGAMMKFSYADLEKKLNALEARIKALEKMVFP